MLRRKGVALIVLCVAVSLAFTAAVFGQAKYTLDKKLVVGFVQMDNSQPWRTAETDSFKNEAANYNIDLKYVDAQDSQANQIKALRSFIAQKVDAIIFPPKVETGWEPVLREAKAAHIPVILVDRGITVSDQSLYVSLLASDFVFEGQQAAKWLAKAVNGKANIVELQGTAGSSPAIDRKKGFDEVIAQNPGIKILVSQTAQFTRATANSTMENLMQAYPSFDAVFGANDEMIIGAIEAMSSGGIDPSKKVTVGYDATTDALDYIKQGKLGATVDQFPGKQAAQALQALVDYIKNKTMPAQKVVYLSPDTVTSAK